MSWMPIKSAVDVLGASRRTLEGRVRDGRIPSYVTAEGRRMLWVGDVPDAVLLTLADMAQEIRRLRELVLERLPDAPDDDGGWRDAGPTPSVTLDPLGEEPGYLDRQLVGYLGSKRGSIALIEEALDQVKRRLGAPKLRVLDGFAGSGVVSRFFKRHSTLLISNDQEPFAAALGRCYLRNRSEVDVNDLEQTAAALERRARQRELPAGFVSRLYAPAADDAVRPGERVYFSRRNARLIDDLRRLIDAELRPEDRPLLLGPLLAEVSRRANTTGTFQGFCRDRATGLGRLGGGSDPDARRRILGEIHLEAPVLSRFECDTEVHRRDVNELVREVDEVDVAYFDPPTSRLAYGSAYFMLNLVTEYREPAAISDAAGIPRGWNRSRYNHPDSARAALGELVGDVRARVVLLAYRDDGLVPHEELLDLLRRHGRVQFRTRTQPAYRGGMRRGRPAEPFVAERLYALEKR